MSVEKIQVESWNNPGELEIHIGNDPTVEPFTYSFRTGLDPKIKSLDNQELRQLRSAVDSHLEGLIAKKEVGPRCLLLCRDAANELSVLIKERTRELVSNFERR